MPKVKALQCALALEIRSVSIGPVPPQPSGPPAPTLDTPENVECPPTPASRGPHPNFLLECLRISSTPLQSYALRTVVLFEFLFTPVLVRDSWTLARLGVCVWHFRQILQVFRSVPTLAISVGTRF